MADHSPQDDDIFLEGELIALRQPDIKKDVMGGHWHSWFNDPEITKYLIHGVFPVNREQQADIVRKEMADPTSLLLVAVSKKSRKHIGVVCLKAINHVLKTASLSIVFGDRSLKGAALEAVALLTKHGFDRLNLQRIAAGQHADHWKWMNSLELIGYQLDGYHQQAGRRDGQTYDVASYSITSECFYDLQKQRGGRICTSSITGLLRQKSTENKTEIMRQFFMDLYDD